MKVFSMRHIYRFAMVSGLVLLTAPYAMSDDAESLYVQGIDLFNNGDYITAADAFRSAYELKPSWKILYNLGQSEAAGKRYALALEAFEGYLAGGGDEIEEERRSAVLSELTRLRKMVGSIEIEAPEGSILYIDDVKRGKAPLIGKIPVTAGITHTVQAKKDGQKVGEAVFKIRGEDTLKIDLTPKESQSDDSAAPPAAPVEQQSEPIEEEAIEKGGITPVGIAGWITTGVGGAELIAAIATGVATRKLDNELSEECPNGVCDTDRTDKQNKMTMMRKTTNILLIAGGATAAVGVTMVVIDAVIKKRKREERAVIVSPNVNPTFVGLQFRGVF